MKRQEELNEAWCKYMCKCSTEIMQALAFALRWCDEHPQGWISVEDALPEDNEWVLCYDNIDRCVSLLRYDGNRWWGDDGYGVDKRVITHWMPTPVPPMKVQEVANDS